MVISPTQSVERQSDPDQQEEQDCNVHYGLNNADLAF
jgi:hypothetical protein